MYERICNAIDNWKNRLDEGNTSIDSFLSVKFKMLGAIDLLYATDVISTAEWNNCRDEISGMDSILKISK